MVIGFWTLFLLVLSWIFPPPADLSSNSVISRPPAEVKAVYVTAYTAQSSRMEDIIKLADETEINAVVINIKEPSGTKFWKGLDKLIAELKQHNIWTIARMVVFQDDDGATRNSNWALRSSGGSLWRDSGGRLWLDPASREVWEYNAEVTKKALDVGFDEINLDYIRFPSDGQVKKIVYPVWNKKQTKEQVIVDFAQWMVREIKNYRPHAVVSADIFGFTLVQDWDVDIGQRAKLLAKYFDVLAPMIYPSHYSSGNFGFTNPAEHPQEVVRETLVKGRAIIGQSGVIIRPWLQDFNMGARYTAELVRAQIIGLEQAGLASGWMLWNPNNKYTEGVLKQ